MINVITHAKADKLRRLIEAYGDARAEAAHAGAQPPEEAETLRQEVLQATQRLNYLIKELEQK